ncbi:MAG: hypothetical protein LBI99_08770, partial [Propionibacteriaceae bacterium]|nr:hypothetical protein [Propionibacteriaceae bacterium]
DAAAAWARRLLAPEFVELAEAAGAADRPTLEQAATDIRAWAADPSAVLCHPDSEILIRIPS